MAPTMREPTDWKIEMVPANISKAEEKWGDGSLPAQRASWRAPAPQTHASELGDESLSHEVWVLTRGSFCAGPWCR